MPLALGRGAVSGTVYGPSPDGPRRPSRRGRAPRRQQVVVDVGGAVPAHEVTGRAAPAEEVVVLTPQDRGPAEDETTGSGRPGRSD